MGEKSQKLLDGFGQGTVKEGRSGRMESQEGEKEKKIPPSTRMTVPSFIQKY